ncbi:recombinase family protein [Kocuria rosea]|uniref:Recombinase family protein n=1 Tax=Kocuria rosea TaxID=1275 RepID=A0A4R5YDB6_KOCRO|nr:recombinase family protein [Kocuria rosea]TDL43050.1 recombinase family protein [Kocuria rosea]
MESGCARVSTAKQDLDRQVDALRQVGITPERICLDIKSGATTDRPGLTAAPAYARKGDVMVVLLALLGQMERTYTLERAAHPRARATAKGRRIGRPSVVAPDKLAYAAHLRETGHTIAEIVAKTGITRTTLYRHLPPRPPEPVTAEPVTVADPDPGARA